MEAELLRSWQHITSSTAQREVLETGVDFCWPFPEIKGDGKIANRRDTLT